MNAADENRAVIARFYAAFAAGTAHWIVRYTFARTGNQVVNDIHSRFRLHDGLVIEQVDRFSFWQWSRQAFGLVGLLVGWTPFLRTTVRRRAKADLASFMTGGSGARPV